METKEIHIKKGTKTAQEVKDYREKMRQFREAAQQGKATEYVRANDQQYRQPV